ncbi:small ribosomal subunit protein uS19-like [Gastrophryne carolinensis]
MSYEQIMQLYCARQRRRLNKGLHCKQNSLLKRLRKAKKEVPPTEKPEVIKTHLRDMIILPEMVGSMVGVYNGKSFNQVEIKPEMIGHYLGEFFITYKPVKHGRPGIGATHSSRFIPLKSFDKDVNKGGFFPSPPKKRKLVPITKAAHSDPEVKVEYTPGCSRVHMKHSLD